MRSVYVTGLGQVSEAGSGADSLWQSLCATAPAASGYGPPADASGTSERARAIFLASCGQAVDMAELAGDDLEGARVGLIVGAFDVDAWLGEVALLESWMHRLGEGAANDPLSRFLRGRRLFLSTACSSGLDAIGLAREWIGGGAIDACLVAAGDVPSASTVDGMRLLRALSPDDVARPFDEARNGTVVKPGCGALVLESADFTRRRNGQALARVAGFGSSTDTTSLVAPDEHGTALRESMVAARGDAASVDAVCAHASGTRLGDAVELEAIAAEVGSSRPTVTANKGCLGHTLGAAGALNAIESVLMIQRGAVPPVANLAQPMTGPAVDLARTTVTRPIERVLATAVGFGGQNAATLFEVVT